MNKEECEDRKEKNKKRKRNETKGVVQGSCHKCVNVANEKYLLLYAKRKKKEKRKSVIIIVNHCVKIN